MIRAFLLLGSNEGDRRQYLDKARKEISITAGRIFIESSLYETAAWGNGNQPSFINQVIGIDTELSAFRLLDTVLKIEHHLGRVRTEKWSQRTIDIDILTYGYSIIQSPELTIPHPRFHERKFTLVPFAEIAPSVVHPVLGVSIDQLLSECSDSLEVGKVNG